MVFYGNNRVNNSYKPVKSPPEGDVNDRLPGRSVPSVPKNLKKTLLRKIKKKFTKTP